MKVGNIFASHTPYIVKINQMEVGKMTNLKERIEKCEKRISKLEELNAPEILIENERNWLRKLKVEENKVIPFIRREK